MDNELDNASDELDNASEMPADLQWQLLEEITNGFSEEQKIGSGGYGVVYKGVYKNGEEIAVKKLYHMPGLDDKQFQNELQNLTRLRHENIVRLVGKSYEERDKCVEYKGKLVCAKIIDRVICLEYLHNGSLENHLCDESSGLPWHKRYKIIKGICDGLKYLHECGIFHLDLKPANILLDKNMEPKIADFGLSRLFSGTDQSHTTINLIGTRGYVPPEYIEKGKISNKFDVFSLGVIIIGIMTGPDGYSKQSDMSSQDFIEQVLENWTNRTQEQWKDESYFDVFCQLTICIKIALNCVETDRHRRPSIGDIICKLNESETYKVNHLTLEMPSGFFMTALITLMWGATVRRVIGGTSGIRYDILCKAAYASLKQNTTITANEWADALESSVAAFSKYGGASAGYRTMLDALILASTVLKQMLFENMGEQPPPEMLRCGTPTQAQTINKQYSSERGDSC